MSLSPIRDPLTLDFFQTIFIKKKGGGSRLLSTKGIEGGRGQSLGDISPKKWIFLKFTPSLVSAFHFIKTQKFKVLNPSLTLESVLNIHYKRCTSLDPKIQKPKIRDFSSENCFFKWKMQEKILCIFSSYT